MSYAEFHGSIAIQYSRYGTSGENAGRSCCVRSGSAAAENRSLIRAHASAFRSGPCARHTRWNRKDTAESPLADATVPQSRGGSVEPDRGHRGIGNRPGAFPGGWGAESNESDVHEVSNYVTALRYGLKRLDELPLSLRFLREVHGKLMADVRGGDRNPGEFRHVQNWIGPPGSRIDTATYVPPPVHEMHGALDQFERYLHDRSPMPVLLRAALVHYHFEAIHPFLDGNGRVGRLLIAFMLHVENVLDQPLLYLSAFFERHRREYYRRLVEVTMKGAWLEWIEFFLQGVTEQANDAVRRTRELLDLSESYRRKIAPARNAGVLSSLIDDLFATPATTIPSVASKLGMSYPAAKKNVQKLVALHILKPRRSGRGSVYVAEDVLKIVEAP